MTLEPPNAPFIPPFYRMMDTLLRTNELVLFGRVEAISPAEEAAVVELLHKRYLAESVDYPHTSPDFAPLAAGWSAKVLFHAAQLLMYRTHEAAALTDFFPPFTPTNAGEILTADLSLRYLPAIIRQLQNIDVEDALVPVLEAILRQWHYSGLLSEVELGTPVFGVPFENPCLLQLYVDRVIEQDRKAIGQLAPIRAAVLGSLGDYAAIYWKNLSLQA